MVLMVLKYLVVHPRTSQAPRRPHLDRTLCTTPGGSELFCTFLRANSGWLLLQRKTTIRYALRNESGPDQFDVRSFVKNDRRVLRISLVNRATASAAIARIIRVRTAAIVAKHVRSALAAENGN